MIKGNCVVAGGGICGVFAAILLADKYSTVYLVEKENDFGGLLKSVTDSSGNLLLKIKIMCIASWKVNFFLN
ncbi:MAG: NAD(P)-binding protein [Colwellia sp.]|nr:NAD(P)-binding protein [Colwellia sp.]NQZ80658.1 NAD(P)-binding protein [Colwellia sp.]